LLNEAGRGDEAVKKLDALDASLGLNDDPNKSNAARNAAKINAINTTDGPDTMHYDAPAAAPAATDSTQSMMMEMMKTMQAMQKEIASMKKTTAADKKAAKAKPGATAPTLTKNTVKKAATKKASTHKDTKSHNVNIRVVSGTKKKAVAKKKVSGLDKVVRRGSKTNVHYSRISGISGKISSETMDQINKLNKLESHWNNVLVALKEENAILRYQARGKKQGITRAQLFANKRYITDLQGVIKTLKQQKALLKKHIK
jgi:hypothetical protein